MAEGGTRGLTRSAGRNQGWAVRLERLFKQLFEQLFKQLFLKQPLSKVAVLKQPKRTGFVNFSYVKRTENLFENKATSCLNLKSNL